MADRPSQDELFAAVDELLAGEPELPPPSAERARLREAAGITQARLAQVLRTSTQTVKNWENGRSEPRPPRREAYLRLLEGWAAKHPAEPATEPVPETFAGPTPPPQHPAPAEGPADDMAPAAHERPPAPPPACSCCVRSVRRPEASVDITTSGAIQGRRARIRCPLPERPFGRAGRGRHRLLPG